MERNWLFKWRVFISAAGPDFVGAGRGPFAKLRAMVCGDEETSVAEMSAKLRCSNLNRLATIEGVLSDEEHFAG